MTQVHNRLSKQVRMALALENRSRVDFRREDIMKVRRAAAEGKRALTIMKEIDFKGAEVTFRKLLKRYQIHLQSRTFSHSSRY